MNSGKLTFTIGGREALPVRAIPYVADWGKVSPEWLTDYLEQGANVARGAISLTAYHCVNDEIVAVLPREWKMVAAKVKGIVQALHEQRPHLSPISDHAGYATYQVSAIKALPPGVFVWLDEFSATCQNHCERNHLGSDPLTLNPVATYDEATRAMVREGFEDRPHREPDVGMAGYVDEEAGDAVLTNDKEAAAYKNICHCLDGYWENTWSQLPKEQRQAWHEALGVIGDEDGKLWDGHSVQWRKGVAESHDYGEDPANAPEIEAGMRLGFWSAVARDFGVPDWKYWLDLPSWTPQEAACLLTELDPNEYDNVASNNNPQPVQLVRLIADIERRADREQKAGRLRYNPSPKDWAEWAHANGYALPRNLRGYCTSSSTYDSEAKDALWNYVTLVRGKEREIADWEGMDHRGIPSEAKTRDDTLTRLRAELEVLKQAPPGAVSAEKLAAGGDGDAAIVGAGATADGGDDWQTKCRKIADELHAKDIAAGAWSNVSDIADRVAPIAIERKIRGPQGQLTAGNILREALQGKKWNEGRIKP